MDQVHLGTTSFDGSGAEYLAAVPVQKQAQQIGAFLSTIAAFGFNTQANDTKSPFSWKQKYSFNRCLMVYDRFGNNDKRVLEGSQRA